MKRSQNSAAKLFVFGYAGFFSFLLLCIILIPHGLQANDGVSFYGGVARTIVPYSLGYLFASYYLFRTAHQLQKESQDKNLAIAFVTMAILIIGLTLTPHNRVEHIHIAFGASLFMLQLFVAIWLATRRLQWYRSLLLTILLVAGLLSAYYLPRSSGFMIQSQLIYQLAFGLLAYDYLRRLPTRSKNDRSQRLQVQK